MFYNKTELWKKIQHYIVTTKEMWIGKLKRLALGNEEIIVYKRKNRNFLNVFLEYRGKARDKGPIR